VFALGLQSLNVNGGHYMAAALTSLIIGLGHIALYRMMPDADPTQILAYLVGGPIGITASMYTHKRTIGRAR
jgi:membrane protease YdiL (CAAX protease family)